MIRRVQNIYYMLAYAFQVLHENGYRDVAAEEFENGLELLSAILCRGVSIQIKRGLGRQYLTREEALSSPICKNSCSRLCQDAGYPKETACVRLR